MPKCRARPRRVAAASLDPPPTPEACATVVALPALAIRAAATKLSGVDEFDLDTRSVELLVSKGFLMLTPYAGVGKVWGTLTPGIGRLAEEKPEGTKVFAGVNLNLGIADLAAEVDRIEGNQTVSVKLGFRL